MRGARLQMHVDNAMAAIEAAATKNDREGAKQAGEQDTARDKLEVAKASLAAKQQQTHYSKLMYEQGAEQVCCSAHVLCCSVCSAERTRARYACML